MQTRLVLGVLALSLWVASPATAAPFTWTMTGTIASTTNPDIAATFGFAGLLVAGEPFTWQVTMESTAPDHYPDFPACGAYTPVTIASLTTNGRTLSRLGGQDYIINADRPGFCDVPNNLARLRLDLRSDPAPLTPRLFLSWHFLGDFPTDALPLTAEGVRSVSLDFTVVAPGASSNAIPIGYGRVTTVASVPEPSVLLLAGVAAVACRWRGRQFRG